MKIVVVGLGYVGLSNAVMLAQHNEVVGVDILQERVNALNSRQSPILDTEISEYLAQKDLNLSASTNLIESISKADYVIISTPTNYDAYTNSFDTSSVEGVISQVIQFEPKACIVVKSTVPVGFVDDLRHRLGTDNIIFAPEFLREGMALFDNLYPSRIIVGEKSKRAEIFANLLAECALKPDVEILFTGTREAEAIKLFSNTYLAMRVSFFNELDSYALSNSMNTREIIDGVSCDPRIGQHYNNPSFGYGGYCLPKDTKQLLSNFYNIPQQLISAVVESNTTRKQFLANQIISLKPKLVGIYRLAMKAGSDNFRDSAVIDIIQILQDNSLDVVIYEPDVNTDSVIGCKVVDSLAELKINCDVIVANRITNELKDVSYKVYSRDIFNRD